MDQTIHDMAAKISPCCHLPMVVMSEKIPLLESPFLVDE